jgi:hypothetical protein
MEMNPEHGKLMCMICMHTKQDSMQFSASDIYNLPAYDRYEMEMHLESDHTIKEIITTLRENHWTMMKI